MLLWANAAFISLCPALLPTSSWTALPERFWLQSWEVTQEEKWVHVTALPFICLSLGRCSASVSDEFIKDRSLIIVSQPLSKFQILVTEEYFPTTLRHQAMSFSLSRTTLGGMCILWSVNSWFLIVAPTFFYTFKIENSYLIVSSSFL